MNLLWNALDVKKLSIDYPVNTAGMIKRFSKKVEQAAADHETKFSNH